jgi:hypothetical protein
MASWRAFEINGFHCQSKGMSCLRKAEMDTCELSSTMMLFRPYTTMYLMASKAALASLTEGFPRGQPFSLGKKKKKVPIESQKVVAQRRKSRIHLVKPTVLLWQVTSDKDLPELSLLKFRLSLSSYEILSRRYLILEIILHLQSCKIFLAKYEVNNTLLIPTLCCYISPTYCLFHKSNLFYFLGKPL